MSLTQAIYTVGTATQTVVAPTNDYAKYVLRNLQPEVVLEYARDGYIFALFARRVINSGATENLSFLTGPYGAQFDYYQLVSESSSIYSTIIEAPTVTTVGAEIPAYNLNRNYPDTHQTVIKAASVVTGGTVIQAEFVTATNQSGAAVSSEKVVTLKPNTQYVLQATNVGNQNTYWYSQIGFSEHFNGLNEIWLGTVDNSYVLKAGDELTMELPPLTAINATSKINSNKLAVMRID